MWGSDYYDVMMLNESQVGSSYPGGLSKGVDDGMLWDLTDVIKDSGKDYLNVVGASYERYSNERGKMAVESGSYSILICKNCEEIILSKDIEVIGDGDALIEIDNSSTAGELIKNSKTAVVLARYLDIMKKRLKLNGDSDNNDAQPFSAEALKKMVVSVPLRSVALYNRTVNCSASCGGIFFEIFDLVTFLLF